MLRALTYSESIFNETIMIILNIVTVYDLCGLDGQKGKKKKKSTGTLRCFSHALDPLGFGAWHHVCSTTRKESTSEGKMSL